MSRTHCLGSRRQHLSISHRNAEKSELNFRTLHIRLPRSHMSMPTRRPDSRIDRSSPPEVGDAGARPPPRFQKPNAHLPPLDWSGRLGARHPRSRSRARPPAARAHLSRAGPPRWPWPQGERGTRAGPSARRGHCGLAPSRRRFKTSRIS